MKCLKEFLKNLILNLILKSSTENYKNGIFNNSKMRVLEKYEEINEYNFTYIKRGKIKLIALFLPICPSKQELCLKYLLSMDKKSGNVYLTTMEKNLKQIF